MITNIQWDQNHMLFTSQTIVKMFFTVIHVFNGGGPDIIEIVQNITFISCHIGNV